MTDFDPSVSLSIGDALPFLWEKTLGILGRDTYTLGLKEWFDNLQHRAYLRAATVQCVGMHTPLPMEDIYRPTRLNWQVNQLTIVVPPSLKSTELEELISLSHRSGARDAMQRSDNQPEFIDRLVIHFPQSPVSSKDFLSIPTNAVISAGPGWGKTTFLHFLFLSHIKSRKFVPILITLGKKGGLDDLEKCLAVIKLSRNLKKRFLLLIDGYDEISTDDRKLVSRHIETFVGSQAGRVYLACREFYDVFDLTFPSVKLEAFNAEDQKHYARAFMKAYGSNQNSDAVLAELTERGLDDLLSHPLLLALVCIVKSGAQSVRSRNVLDLIERAMESLSFRWDEWKGVDREQSTPLDGRARVHCLMRVAHAAEGVRTNERTVMHAVRQQLDKYKWDDLDERKVIREIARFFGILVPADSLQWEFVHRTLYDYLAACFITENGGLDAWKEREGSTQWAYAACRSSDATRAMLAMLKSGKTEVFVEMLSNDAPFEHGPVADALFRWYEEHRQADESMKDNSYGQTAAGETYVRMDRQFLGVASTKFLHYLAERCSEKRSKANDTFLAYSIAELNIRRVQLSQATLANMRRHFRLDEELFAFIGSEYVKVLNSSKRVTPRSRS